MAVAKPRIRKVLDQLSAIRDACGTAKVICSLPIPRYVDQQCCSAENHIDNHSEEEIIEVLCKRTLRSFRSFPFFS